MSFKLRKRSFNLKLQCTNKMFLYRTNNKNKTEEMEEGTRNRKMMMDIILDVVKHLKLEEENTVAILLTTFSYMLMGKKIYYKVH